MKKKPEPLITSGKAETERLKLNSIWSGESRLSQKILIAILAHFERAEERAKKVRPPRKQSAYQKFFAANIKRGLSAAEVGKAWHVLKSK